MNEIDKIVARLNLKFNCNFQIVKKLPKKPTARSLQKYILADENKNKYLLEIATNDIEIFYFNRTIQFQEEFSRLRHNFKLNMPINIQIGNKLSYSLYKYYENIIYLKNNKPVELLQDFYTKNSVEIELNEENIKKIISNFLSAWPNRYHSMIKRQKEFRLYIEELKKIKTIKVAFEHGDFCKNNIALINSDIYLFDFEFSRFFQPIGFDIFDYYQSNNISKKDIIYSELHKIKYNLINKINRKIDNNEHNIEIYKTLNDVELNKKWEELYFKGANYNLSLDWCKSWLKYFKKANQELFIFTIWQNDKLMLLAPFYRQKNILYLIGTNPDLFDNFDILYKNEKYTEYMLNYIFKKGYQIDFKYLNADTKIAKNLIKYLYQKNIYYESIVIDTNPKVNFDKFKIKKYIKNDIKRLKNKALKKFGEPFKFDFNVKKELPVLDEFILLHKKRWNGGPFKNIKKLDLFIKEISLTDLVILSKLSIKNNTVAFNLLYKSSNKILSSAIPCYNDEFNDISPGKVLLYEILEYCKLKGDKVFDFGRGAEEYKYWFATDSSVLFHIKTYNKKNILVKLKFIINKIINKIIRILSV